MKPNQSPKTTTPQRNRPSPAGSAESVSGPAENQRKARDAPVAPEIAKIPLDPAEGPIEKVWDDYFRKHDADPRAVVDVVQRLHKAKRTDAVIACINAALINGRSQPWMYTVLALEMERAGKPKEDIERVLLSTVDFSAVNVSNILYSAAVLTRFGAKERALAMYEQASKVDPTRLEPYAMGLRLAREAENPEAVAWAAGGILQRAWGVDYEKLHRDAKATAESMEEALRKVGNDAAAERLAQAVAEAAKIDLAIELSWSGKADLDLKVEEPSGAICSAENPATMGGGIFVHDGFGGDQKDCYDRYVCPRGMSGDYRAIVQHMSGDVVGKRAVLEVVRYKGSSREIVDRFTIKLSDHEKVVRVTLQHGRLKELAAVPLLEAPREDLGTARGNRRERLARNSRESQRAGARFVEDRMRVRNALGGPGYQPVITIIADGVTSTANAVVSGDRRYVRMSLVPTFSTLTDVQTFSFISAAGSNPNTTQAGGGSGGGGLGNGGGGGGVGIAR